MVNPQQKMSKEFRLHDACVDGDVDLVSQLVEDGEDVNCENKDGFTALHFAALHGHMGIVKYLLSHGGEGSTTVQNKEGSTPLHCGSLHGGLVIVNALLTHGGDGGVNTRNDDGLTALHIAADNGHFDAANFLIRFGADASLPYPPDGTPSSAYLPTLQAAIKAAGPPPPSPGLAGLPLHEACADGDQTRVVKRIKEHLAEGADVNAKDKSGFPVITSAIFEGYSNVVAVLLEHGADAFLNERDPEGCTPLHWAGMEGNVGMATLMIRWGADPSISIPHAEPGATYTRTLAAAVEAASKLPPLSSQPLSSPSSPSSPAAPSSSDSQPEADSLPST